MTQQDLPDEWMPILGSPLAVKMSVLSEAQAMKNHGQTLKRLRERGGISLHEAAAIALCQDPERIPEGTDLHIEFLKHAWKRKGGL